MLTKRSKPRVYSQADWDTADRFGKILIHLMEPDKWPLNNRDEEYLKRMRQVWAIMVENGSQRTRVKMIGEVMGINERNVKALMEDAQAFFGDLLSVDCALEKAVIAEEYWRLYEKSYDVADYETAAKVLEKLVKLRGYDREDGGIKREDLVLPDIIFTSNPKALTTSAEEGEEIDYENLDLLEPEAVAVFASEGTD